MRDNPVVKGLAWFAGRSLILYLLLAAVLFKVVDWKHTTLKVLDHLRDVPFYLLDVAADKEDPEVPNLRAGLRYYDHFLKLFPSSAEAYSAKGFCYYHLGEIQRAEAAYTKAVSLDPTLFGAYHNLGLIAHQQGDFKKAVHWFERAVAVPVEKAFSYPKAVIPYRGPRPPGQLSDHQKKYLDLMAAYAESQRHLSLSRQEKISSEGKKQDLYYYAPVRVLKRDGKKIEML